MTDPPDADWLVCAICDAADGELHDLIRHLIRGSLDTRSRGVVIRDSPEPPYPATYERPTDA
jgi:hypothetical protein